MESKVRVSIRDSTVLGSMYTMIANGSLWYKNSQWCNNIPDLCSRERERILFATALQAYQKGYKPI